MERKKKKILVVDDEPHIVLLVSNRLKANNYDVVTASDGEEAIAVVDRENPDLVVLDLMLPKKNGYQVCEDLKSNIRYSGLTVVMLTAKGEIDDMRGGFYRGADAYVNKPFKPEVLLGIIQGLLGGSQQ